MYISVPTASLSVVVRVCAIFHTIIVIRQDLKISISLFFFNSLYYFFVARVMKTLPTTATHKSGHKDLPVFSLNDKYLFSYNCDVLTAMTRRCEF